MNMTLVFGKSEVVQRGSVAKFMHTHSTAADGSSLTVPA